MSCPCLYPIVGIYRGRSAKAGIREYLTKPGNRDNLNASKKEQIFFFSVLADSPD